LIQVIVSSCQAYYPPPRGNVKNNVQSLAPNGDIVETDRDDIFKKLSDGITNWLTSQGKFVEILKGSLMFFITCKVKSSTASSEESFKLKCPVSSCSYEKMFPMVYQAYARSTKNKKDTDTAKLCPPRWFFASLKNHFLKHHLDSQSNRTETPELSAMTTDASSSMTIEPIVIQSDSIESETIESETIESETIESETIEPETIESEIIEPETIESDQTSSIVIATVNIVPQITAAGLAESEANATATFSSEIATATQQISKDKRPAANTRKFKPRRVRN
ncbi:hypothetical protein Bhyg_03504, partial [Pseudolycoriella hygida]